MKIMKIADFARILKSVYVLSAYLCRWPSFPDGRGSQMVFTTVKPHEFQIQMKTTDFARILKLN